MRTAPLAFLIVATFSAALYAGDVVVQLPDGVAARSAEAVAPSHKPGEEGPAVEGEAQGQTATFTRLDPATPHDLKITLKDGTVLHGVNLGWYNEEPAKPHPDPISDDDREQIRALVSDVTSFYNISRIVTLAGDHDRATVLVERIRSTGFHSDSGGEVIWRVELWYFKNHHGGWNELTQTNKVLRRTRFKTHAEYQATEGPLRWVPALGGIVAGKEAGTKTITLPAEAVRPPEGNAAPADGAAPAEGVTPPSPPGGTPERTPGDRAD